MIKRSRAFHDHGTIAYGDEDDALEDHSITNNSSSHGSSSESSTRADQQHYHHLLAHKNRHSHSDTYLAIYVIGPSKDHSTEFLSRTKKDKFNPYDFIHLTENTGIGFLNVSFSEEEVRTGYRGNDESTVKSTLETCVQTSSRIHRHDWSLSQTLKEIPGFRISPSGEIDDFSTVILDVVSHIDAKLFTDFTRKTEK